VTLRKIKIAPSILAGDQGNLAGAVRAADDGGADVIHLDVIDGHFAPNITFGPGVVKALRRTTSLPFDSHLMIDEPLRYVNRFIDAGSDIIHFHAEVLDGPSFDELRNITKAARVKLGLALKPETPLPEWADKRLDAIDVLLVMTVNPGFSGQSLMAEVLPKLSAVGRLIVDRGVGTEVEVDGGVEASNAGEVVRRGASILVAGAGVYARPSLKGAISELRERAMEATLAK
jgi:ribulose-phosphate 3-epimerase